jgi:hypothetical protein
LEKVCEKGLGKSDWKESFFPLFLRDGKSRIEKKRIFANKRMYFLTDFGCTQGWRPLGIRGFPCTLEHTLLKTGSNDRSEYKLKMKIK